MKKRRLLFVPIEVLGRYQTLLIYLRTVKVLGANIAKMFLSLGIFG